MPQHRLTSGGASRRPWRRRRSGRPPTTSPRPTHRRSASTRATSSRPTASTSTSPTATGCASCGRRRHVVGEPELPEGSHQLLLDGDRLLVVTSSWTGSADTIVSLFDVSDPANATLLRRSHLEGAVLATRSVDDVARLVISTSFDTRLPFVQPSQFGLDEELALERNQQIIAESDGRGLAAPLVRRGGRRHVRPDAADPRLQHGRGTRRLRRARADVDRLGRPARRRHTGRLGRRRVDRRHRVLLGREPVHHDAELGLAVPADAGRRRGDRRLGRHRGRRRRRTAADARSTSSTSARERRRPTSLRARCRAGC